MRRKVIVVFILVACAVIGLLLWRGGAQTRTLSDGSRLARSGVRAGRTNVYWHGSFVSKTIGRFAPSNGWSVGTARITRPTKVTVDAWTDSDVLAARFELFPATGRADDFLNPPFQFKFRLLLIGDDGFSHVHDHPA